MTDATADFYNELRNRGHEPLLGKTSGTLRFDLVNGMQTATRRGSRAQLGAARP